MEQLLSEAIIELNTLYNINYNRVILPDSSETIVDCYSGTTPDELNKDIDTLRLLMEKETAINQEMNLSFERPYVLKQDFINDLFSETDDILLQDDDDMFTCQEDVLLSLVPGLTGLRQTIKDTCLKYNILDDHTFELSDKHFMRLCQNEDCVRRFMLHWEEDINPPCSHPKWVYYPPSECRNEFETYIKNLKTYLMSSPVTSQCILCDYLYLMSSEVKKPTTNLMNLPDFQIHGFDGGVYTILTKSDNKPFLRTIRLMKGKNYYYIIHEDKVYK